MITPSFGLTATERVLPRLTLDWTTGLAQSGVDVTRAGVATFVGSNGLIQSATADTQRIDYSTGTAGLLVEESRTNLIEYSNDFRDTAAAGETRPWTNRSTTIDPDSETGPDGIASMSKIEETATTDAFWVDEEPAGNASQVYTWSVYAKQGENRYLRLTVQNVSASGDFFRAHFDLQTKTVTTSGAFNNAVFVDAKIEDFGDGICRCLLIGSVGTVSAAINVRTYIQLIQSTTSLGSGGSYAGTAGNGLYVWGAQLEAGAFPTSYIPTEASAVTRNADVATVTGTNFSDFFNPIEGTFEIDFLPFVVKNASSVQTVLSISDGTNTNLMEIYKRANADVSTRLVVTTAGAGQVFANAGVFTATNTKIVMGYKENNFAICRNAANVVVDTSASVPTVDRLALGTDAQNVNLSLLNGHISKLKYWPFRLINAEVQSFSK